MNTHHIFLSPHLDDVILSCGGTLAQLVAQQPKQQINILTIFAGIPSFENNDKNDENENNETDVEPEKNLSTFAKLQHSQWGTLEQAYLARQAEDKAALAFYKLKPTWLPFLDCIYRGLQTKWYYTSDEDIFGSIHPEEYQLPLQIAEVIQNYITDMTNQAKNNHIILYAPLTIGNHVDHQLTFLAVLQLIKYGYTIYFYEDYPYIQRHPHTLKLVLQKQTKYLAEIINLAQTDLTTKQILQPKIIQFSSQHLATKIKAIAAYASQLQNLFGRQRAMEQQVTAFGKQTPFTDKMDNNHPTECFWVLNK